MAWTDMISGCFGFGTAPFASYPQDTDTAKRAIAVARAEGASRDEFAQAIAIYPGRYIKSAQLLRERVREDSARFDKLWKVSRRY